MKQKLFSLMLLMFVCGMHTTVLAQNAPKAKIERKAAARMTSEQFMQRQIRYVAEQVGLDESKKDEFITLYKNYLTEQKACQKEWRTQFGRRDKKENKELTDAEITERIEGRFAQSHKILDLREKYYNEFKKILTPVQIQKMYKAEKEIQKKVRSEVGRRYKNLKNKNK